MPYVVGVLIVIKYIYESTDTQSQDLCHATLSTLDSGARSRDYKPVVVCLSLTVNLWLLHADGIILSAQLRGHNITILSGCDLHCNAIC